MEAVDRAIAIYAALPRDGTSKPAVLRGIGDAQSIKVSLLHQIGSHGRIIRAHEARPWRLTSN